MKSTFYLLIALFISGLAQGMTLVAVPWYMTSELDLTPEWSLFYLGMTGLVIPWTFIAGRVVDRNPRKRIFIIENIAAGSFLIAASFLSDAGPQVAYIAPLVFAWNYFFFNIHYPALYAYLQSLHDDSMHMKVVSWIEIQGQVSNMGGGILAAILLGAGELTTFLPEMFQFAAWDLSDVFLLDGITYFMALMLIVWIQDQPLIVEPDTEINLKPVIQFVRTNPVVFWIGFFSYFAFATALVEGFYSSAVYNKVYFEGSALTYSLAGAAFAGGALISGLTVPRFERQLSTEKGMIAMLSCTAIGFFVGTVWISTFSYILCIFLVGAGNAGTRVFRATYLMKNIPNNMYGRVANIYTVLNLILRMMLIAICSLPFLLDVPRLIFGFLGCVCVAGAMGTIAFYGRSRL